MKTNKSLSALVLFLLISTVCVSQGTPPPAPLESARVPPPGLPIDGGLIILVVVGIVYGVYKLISLKKSLKA
ncbi:MULTISPECIES: PID-CTERM protein-sorting domain-containing protein [unclassified Olleya]|uniref:PID-CTERM protein-sorting domain-containing protein n=1 Tax=unclassified Olleya TaxID=2615019 RepID=UPI000C300E9F|nr:MULTISPECIES: hypothetical protein [unclassified Olleya]AUC74641.1 hypothetical protein CW732_02685 [Olleya sp. Bg11-27]QXP60564.1 hypothetical protein H0I26_02655 [Olleya sp. HaHaR_3_96]